MLRKLLNKLMIKKNSIIFSWFVSYLTVIILFLVLFMFIFNSVQSSYRKEISRSNKYLLDHTKTNLDKIIEELRSNASDIALNSKIYSVLGFGSNLRDSQYFEALDLVNSLKKIKSLNKNIDTIIILNRNKDTVISIYGISDIKTFYTVNFADSYADYNKWLKEFEPKVTEKYFITGNTDSGKNSNRTINYIRSVSLTDTKDLSCCVLITVKTDVFIKQMEEIKKINASNMYIIDDNANLIASTRENPIKSYIYDDFKNESGVIYTHKDSHKYVVSYIRSSVNKWIYICEENEGEYMAKIKSLQYVVLRGLLIILLLEGGLILFFIRKNSTPVYGIMSLFKGQNDLNASSNEYSIIQNAIQKTLNDNTVLDKQLYKQKVLLKNRFIEKILKGQYHNDNTPINETLDFYDIQFKSEYFAVMSFFIEEYENLQPNQSDYSSYTFNEIVFIFTNIVEELLAAKHFGIMVECEGTMICLVNIQLLEQWKQDLLEVVQNSKQFIRKHFGIIFTVSISSIIKGVEGTNIAYNQALDVMKYKQVLGITNTMCYDDIEDIHNETYYYPFDKEQQLINLLKTGNYSESVNLVDEIFQENLKKKALTLDLAQCLVLNIAASMIRTVNEMSDSTAYKFLDQLNPMVQLLPCKTIDDMKKQLYSFIHQICKYMEETKEENINWVKTDVVPFISDNYQDVNLSVSMIAEHFNVHPVYISRLFKEQMGEGLLEYISRTRVEVAKMLLKNKDYTLDDISNMVGYTNARTLSRMFKKFEGVTPGKYREI